MNYQSKQRNFYGELLENEVTVNTSIQSGETFGLWKNPGSRRYFFIPLWDKAEVSD